ncbi:MAG TPA: ArsR family transcriptional regulator [Pyrinomonadaceae bacterium]|nr:ArsR family transcriptional regulator [Pyrinomonadaceae bacterium]
MKTTIRPTKLDERFFESTRGRIVNLLRGNTRTVNELTEELGVTDNAVRAQLLSLERDGLVRQSGVQRGHRKPHFAYELTPEAEYLFPKAYDALLNQLLSVLKDRLSRKAIEEVLREVGRSLAGREPKDKKTGLEDRAQNALRVLEGLGGAARLEKEDGGLVIKGESCPLAAAVVEHPEVCQLAETLLAEIVGAPVHEHCDRNGPPRCRFAIDKNSPVRQEISRLKK